MTDKQIIIDGVDVSECPCIQSNNIGDVVCVRLARTSLYCEGQPCYYKALERKEQECEELKKYLNQIRDEELSHLDIEWNEYETSARKYDYSNIITLVERALGEIDD